MTWTMFLWIVLASFLGEIVYRAINALIYTFKDAKKYRKNYRTPYGSTTSYRDYYDRYGSQPVSQNEFRSTMRSLRQSIYNIEDTIVNKTEGDDQNDD